MPKFTIDLTPAAVTRLQALVAAYNGDNGAALTVADWIVLHLKELAVAQDLAVTGDTLRVQIEKQAQADLQAAVTAERDRLIASLGGQ